MWYLYHDIVHLNDIMKDCAMPFEKGHKWYPPKNGKVPGHTKERAKRTRILALEVNEQVPASALVRYHVLRAMGKPGVKLDEDEDGDISAVWDEQGGTIPTPAEIERSVNWLADRGHGLPAQSVHLTAHLKQHIAQVSASVEIKGELSPAVVSQMRRMLQTARTTPAMAEAVVSSALPAGDTFPGDVIDVPCGDPTET